MASCSFSLFPNYTPPLESTPKIHILVGPPCGGKTTLLKMLAAQDFPIVDEAARTIMREGHKSTDRGFDKKVAKFQSAMETKVIALAKEENKRDVISDRSVCDPYIYSHFWTGGASEKLQAIVKKSLSNEHGHYSKKVFFIELLPEELYVQDNERKEPYETAVKISEALRSGYVSLGFDIISIPYSIAEVDLAASSELKRVTSNAKRIDLILKHIQGKD